MSREEKNTQEEKDIIEEMEVEVDQIENEEWQIDEEKLEDAVTWEYDEEISEKKEDTLSRVMADFENYKKRVERDREEMIFFLKKDILKNILPRVDDMERIIKNTPEELKENALYEWVVSMHKKLVWDLDKMWVKPFDSIWEEIDPNKHDVMTTVPGQESWIIFDEFEKWYMLWDTVLRHAKVVVGA